MFDLWAFLVQTLNASGVALLLLLIKRLFKDKLPPRWHFAVWGVLGIILLLPAGFNGRYTLFRWQVLVEAVKYLLKDYSFTQVRFPFPVLLGLPKTLTEYIFAGYVIGVVFFILKYTASYIRLRLLLRKGVAPEAEITARIKKIAAENRVKCGRIITVSNLPSAFVCGIVRPVLVIPADSDIDDKVILHELFHLKHKDTALSVIITLFRCIHWCNPLIWYCANRAINDMEARCDWYVLSRLEGEQRRDYGRILLAMSNDRFAKTPGSTCINNGGKNIRERIETIARFKKYPVGMGLVSVCVIIILAVSLSVGARASKIYDKSGSFAFLSAASAKSISCTTPAGAFDTYAKAVIAQNGFYRIICAPRELQSEIITETAENEKAGIYPNWECGFNELPDSVIGYYMYNLKKCGKNIFEGLFVIKTGCFSDDDIEEDEETEDSKMRLTVQRLRIEKQSGRWVSVPLENFKKLETEDESLDWGCKALPGTLYCGTAQNFRVEVKVQTVYTVDGALRESDDFWIGDSDDVFNTEPNPNADFTNLTRTQDESLTHLGTREERDKIGEIGLSAAPVYPGEKRPDTLRAATENSESGSSSDGVSWSSQTTEPGWGPTVTFGGGGGTFDPQNDRVLPDYYVADLYIDGKLAERLDLYPDKEATS